MQRKRGPWRRRMRLLVRGRKGRSGRRYEDDRDWSGDLSGAAVVDALRRRVVPLHRLGLVGRRSRVTTSCTSASRARSFNVGRIPRRVPLMVSRAPSAPFGRGHRARSESAPCRSPTERVRRLAIGPSGDAFRLAGPGAGAPPQEDGRAPGPGRRARAASSASNGQRRCRGSRRAEKPCRLPSSHACTSS